MAWAMCASPGERTPPRDSGGSCPDLARDGVTWDDCIRAMTWLNPCGIHGGGVICCTLSHLQQLSCLGCLHRDPQALQATQAVELLHGGGAMH